MKLFLKRGSKNDVLNYVGDKGELFVDTDNNQLRLSDGNTTGGKLISFKSDIPSKFSQLTNDIINSYLITTYHSNSTFYRKYSDGFIEQGGYHNANATITFPIAFTSTNYYLYSAISFNFDNATGIPQVLKVNNTSFKLRVATSDNIFNWTDLCYWYACGY